MDTPKESHEEAPRPAKSKKRETMLDRYMNQLIYYGGLAVPRHLAEEDLRRSWRAMPGHERDGLPEGVSKFAGDAFYRVCSYENSVPPGTQVMTGVFVDGELVPGEWITTPEEEPAQPKLL